MSSSSSSSSSINPIPSNQLLPRKPSSAINTTNPSNSNSNSFAKSSFQSFGRVGDHPSSPGLFNTNHHLSNVKKSLNQLNLNPTQQPSIGNQTQNRARKLGSFNSLAVSTSPSTTTNPNHLSASRNNHHPQAEERPSPDDQHQHPIIDDKLDHPSTDPNSTYPQIDHHHQLLSVPNLPQHRLRSKWVFWLLHRPPSKKISEEEFGKAMRRLGSCDTVETFYSIYLHIKRPSSHLPITDLHIFIDPIQPAWEDPMNVNGGRWTIRLRKGLANRLWETLIFSLIGGGLEKLIANSSSESSNDHHSHHHHHHHHHHLHPDGHHRENDPRREICGAVLSIRRDEDILAVWHKTGSPDSGGDGKMAKQVKLSLQTVLQLPLNCTLAYKLNAECLSSTAVNQLSTTNTTAGHPTTPLSATTTTTPHAHFPSSQHHHQHHQPGSKSTPSPAGAGTGTGTGTGSKNDLGPPPNGTLSSSSPSSTQQPHLLAHKSISNHHHNLNLRPPSSILHQTSPSASAPSTTATSPSSNLPQHPPHHLQHSFGNPSIGTFGNLGNLNHHHNYSK